MEIVKEIITAIKGVVETNTGFTQLDYEHDILKNSDRAVANRYGFIPLGATFVNGSAMGFTTMEHTFQLILTTDYLNKDGDNGHTDALNQLYAKVHALLKEIQKKGITLPTSGYNVLLTSGINFEEAEHFDENSTIVLRTNINITYRFKNNF